MGCTSILAGGAVTTKFLMLVSWLSNSSCKQADSGVNTSREFVLLQQE